MRLSRDWMRIIVPAIIKMIINNENVHFYQGKSKTLSLVQKDDNNFISIYRTPSWNSFLTSFFWLAHWPFNLTSSPKKLEVWIHCISSGIYLLTYDASREKTLVLTFLNNLVHYFTIKINVYKQNVIILRFN